MSAPDRALARAAWAWIAATGLFHLLLVSHFPLAADETYYWDWSRHLALGYYDQGPMVAWWIRGSCLLFGDTALGIRFGIVVACFATQAFIYLLARDLFNPRVALLSVIASSITPLAVVGSFIATYDPLVALFWAAATYFAARAFFLNCRAAWLGLGISFGLGLLSKHTMLFFACALFLFLIVSPKHRFWLRKPQPYLSLLLAIVVFAPNLWWQSQHEWITFRHLFLLTGKGLDQPFWRRFGDFLGSQIGLVTPLLFFAMVAAMIWAVRNARKEEFAREWYLAALSAPIILLFTVMTAKSKVQANWAVCGWIAAPVLWAAWLDYRARRDGKDGLAGWDGFQHLVKGNYTRAALAIGLILTLILSWPDARAIVPVKVPPIMDIQISKLFGGRELGEAVGRARTEMEAAGNAPVTVGALTYDVTSRIGFYTPGQPNPYCFYLGTRLNGYYLWQEPYRPKSGGCAVIADDFAPNDPERPRFEAIFQRVEPVSTPVQVYRRGIYDEPVHTYYLYKCYGYTPNTIIETPKGG